MSNSRQESQIPPPLWRGPSRRECSPAHPIDTPLHIQPPQKVTDSDKLLYIFHPARGDSDSGEHSPADSKGAGIHPGPALRKAHSLEHIDIEARSDPASREHSPAKYSGIKDLPDPADKLKDKTAHKEGPASKGPDSREHSTAKPSRDTDDSMAHSSTHRTAHKSNPASRGPNLKEHSTAHPRGLSNPSGKTEETFSKGHHTQRHTSDHPPPTPSKSESKHSVLTPEQRKCILTLVRSIRKRKTDTKPTKESESATSETPSKPKSSVESKDLHLDTSHFSETGDTPSPVPPPSEDTDSKPSSEHSEVTFLPPSPRSPASPDPTTPRSPSPDRTTSPIPTMGTVTDLAVALTEKLKDIGRHPTTPSLNLEVKRENIQMIIARKWRTISQFSKLNQMMIRKRDFWKPCLKKLEDGLVP